MKYIVTISEKRRGNIQISAENYDEAKQKAEDIIEINPSRVLWDASEYQIAQITEKPLVCSNCNSEIPLDSQFCNKCGAKIELENDIDLGKILFADFNQDCKTKIMFDTYNGYKTDQKYDTLVLKTCHRVVSENNTLYVSFYLKRNPLDTSSHEISTSYTITDLRSTYSPGLVTRVHSLSDIEKYTSLHRYYGRNPMKLEIVKAIGENKFDLNGDFFFSVPFAINALSHKGKDNSVTNDKYYIIGVNLRKNK